MNLYSKISKKLGEESEKIAKSAMKGVTKRLIGVTMYKNPEGVDVSVNIGGTWQEGPMRRSMVLCLFRSYLERF